MSKMNTIVTCYVYDSSTEITIRERRQLKMRSSAFIQQAETKTRF